MFRNIILAVFCFVVDRVWAGKAPTVVVDANDGPDFGDGTDAEGFPGGDTRMKVTSDEDVCVWPDGTWCSIVDVEEMMASPCAMSDDFTVYPHNSFEAAYHTGALEEGCEFLFGHKHWQVLSDENCAKLHTYLGI